MHVEDVGQAHIDLRAGMFMDLFGYYVNILAVVFSAIFMFFKIVGGRYRHHGHGNHGPAYADDIEKTLLNHHSRASSTNNNSDNTFLFVEDKDAKTGKDCVVVEHIEHADTGTLAPTQP